MRTVTYVRKKKRRRKMTVTVVGMVISFVVGLACMWFLVKRGVVIIKVK
jgi:undecaprenyl pyrophosphate phosphatase UppP